MFSETVGPLLYKPNHMKNIVNAMTVIVPISNMPNSVSRMTEPAACNCIHVTIFTFLMYLFMITLQIKFVTYNLIHFINDQMTHLIILKE